MRIARIFSFWTAIRFCVTPKRELGRSITNRGGESNVRISGITGPPLERISIAGTPRSCTTRTLVTVGGGPNVWAAATLANSTAATLHADFNVSRGTESLTGSIEGNISPAPDKREVTRWKREASRAAVPAAVRPGVLAGRARSIPKVRTLKARSTNLNSSVQKLLPSRFRQKLVLLNHGGHPEFAVISGLIHAHDAPFALHADALSERDF